MAPKKDKGKGKEKNEEAAQGTGGFTEVEKTFLELQLAECNRKLARLRTAVDEYEQRNEQLQKDYDKLDEDRADIIAYLKKTLNVKNEENAELKDKVRGLEETRDIETSQFNETVKELERNFTIMKEQLTSENKLLAGKLNTLEEFRAIRDDLMIKFETQEKAFEDQEMKYKRIIYDTEKKFVIGKDKLKKEMEARLLQLAQDFQDATELRIAASTHRVIRENIALNNELDSILSTQAKLADLSEKYKESEKSAKVAMELAEEERDKAINKSVVQLKVIDQLTNAFQDVKKEKALYEKRSYDFDSLQFKIQNLTKENESLSLKVRILEQNLLAKMSDQNKTITESAKAAKESVKVKKILKEAACAIQAALKLDQWVTVDPTREIMDRQALLVQLLDIILQYREMQPTDSQDTLASFEKIYKEGDLGFIPKPASKKSAALAPLYAKPSRESLKIDKRITVPSVSVSTSSVGSIKTIPSVKLIPPASELDMGPQDSLPSFIMSSLFSESVTSEEIPESEDMTDIEKQLAKSKLEIQKSIMKDMAISQMEYHSQSQIQDEQKRASKSVVIMETLEDEEKDKERRLSEEIAEGEEKSEDDAQKKEDDENKKGDSEKTDEEVEMKDVDGSQEEE